MARQVPKLLLYKRDASPPSCAVMMIADILGLKMDYKEPDLLKLEHKSEEFKKINPIGTIPVLQDDDFVISQSHAIIKYLLNKYGGEHRERLYPSEARKRALIDQSLYFDASILFNRLKVVALPTLLEGLPAPLQEHLDDIDEAYSVIEAYLQKSQYIAANNFTIADISVGSTTAALQAIRKLDETRFPRSVEWLALINNENCFKNVSNGFALFGKLLNIFWQKNKHCAQYVVFSIY
ncbi:unnamed protein product, partial [Brenthis ino]